MRRCARNPRGRDLTRREIERYGDPSAEDYWLAVGQEIRRQGDPGLGTPWSSLRHPDEPATDLERAPEPYSADRDARREVSYWLRGLRHDGVGSQEWARIMAHAARRGILWPDRWNEAAHTYVSPRTRSLTDHEAWVRGVAYALKRRDTQPDVMNDRMVAAGEIFALVPPDAVLVPVPSSDANPELYNPTILFADELAWFHHDSSVVEAVLRRFPMVPSHQRRRHGSPGATVEEHVASMILAEEIPPDRPVVIVDNVIASGASIEAVRRILGRPDARGLAWAQALQDPMVKTNPSSDARLRELERRAALDPSLRPQVHQERVRLGLPLLPDDVAPGREFLEPRMNTNVYAARYAFANDRGVLVSIHDFRPSWMGGGSSFHVGVGRLVKREGTDLTRLYWINDPSGEWAHDPVRGGYGTSFRITPEQLSEPWLDPRVQEYLIETMQLPQSGARKARGKKKRK